MNTPLDESLHSFLVRNQLIHMHKFDPKGVIAKNGRWRVSPFAHHEATHVFEKYDDLFLLETIDVDIQLSSRDHRFFDAPDSYCLSIQRTFFEGRHSCPPSGEMMSIAYCPRCMKEMIKEIGFGYFRKSWRSGHICRIHGTALHTINSESYETSIKAVRKLLAGKKVPSKVLAHVPELNRKPEASSQRLRLFYPIRTVECSARVIGLRLAKCRDELMSMGFQIEEHWIRRWLRGLVDSQIDSKEHKQARAHLGHLMSVLQNFKPLADFINKEFSYARLWVGPRKQLSEILLLPKERQCSTCENKQCGERIADSQEVDNIDLQYLTVNSTSLRRLGFQQMHLPSTGPHLWSPIRIKDWESKEEIKENSKILLISG